jgi:chromosomal replication initiation ATPase DnaA
MFDGTEVIHFGMESCKSCIVTITATCTGITLDELKQVERELKQREIFDSVKVSVLPYNANGPVVMLQHVLYACAKMFGVEPESVIERDRTQMVAFARHAYCHIASAYGYTMEQVGAKIARSYSTVIASIKVSKNLIFSGYSLYKQPFEAARTLLEQQREALTCSGSSEV